MNFYALFGHPGRPFLLLLLLPRLLLAAGSAVPTAPASPASPATPSEAQRAAYSVLIIPMYEALYERCRRYMPQRAADVAAAASPGAGSHDVGGRKLLRLAKRPWAMYLSERWLHNRYRGRDKGYCPTVWDMVVTSMPVNPLLLFSYQSHSLRQLEAYHKCFANKLEEWLWSDDILVFISAQARDYCMRQSIALGASNTAVAAADEDALGSGKASKLDFAALAEARWARE